MVCLKGADGHVSVGHLKFAHSHRQTAKENQSYRRAEAGPGD